MVWIGIDIGTTSICGVLYDDKKDELVRKIQGQNCFLEEGSFCQSPEKIVNIVRELLIEILERKQGNQEYFGQRGEDTEIGGIGISSQMHGILYVDCEGKAVSPFYTWKNEWGNEIYRDGKTYAEYLSEKIGGRLYSGYGSVTHFYLQDRGMIPRSAVAFVNIGDYLAMELTGEKKAKVDVTMAASFGGFALKEREFDFRSLEKAGMEVSFYPEVMGGAIEGYFLGIPVCCAIGDNQASFLGAVRDRRKSISVNVGTGSQVSVFSDELFKETKAEVRPFPGGGWLYVGASVNGGKVYERLAEFLGEIAEFFGDRPERDALYEKMAQLGGKKKITNLQTIPTLYGERGKEAGKAAILGVTEDNFHGADLIRSFVTGMARELYDLYQELPRELWSEKTCIIASGNGIRKNMLMKEEIENVFQLPVIFTGREEEAATGAAINAIYIISKKKTEVDGKEAANERRSRN